MNRTLNERARSMRLHSGLPHTFWADAINTAAFLVNRGPSVPLEFKIPEEVWSSKKVNLSFLRVFGCLAYVHVDANARSKLDAKSSICYFIGYGDAEMGYRFYDLKNRKIIRSKDVIFNEEVLYKDRQKVLEEKEVGEKVTAATPRKTDSVSSKWHNLDHAPTPESKPEDPFGDMPPLEEAGTDEETVAEDEENTSDTMQETETPGSRRSERASRPTQMYSPSANFLLLTDKGEPVSYDEAVQCDDAIKWELAMKRRWSH
ncbi:hypothetical protein LIER_16357 [Lithospermum erythrorhizon]|uniref:Retroviral polymerase SH3-like domain-containing protein n=1 Tax=Lithospermum erythrorhizon TaxID=34254 RepID=A0AAV3Q6Q9_LITER